MTRPRRSLLFLPGDARRKIEKAITTAPDSIIMDLEDGVAVNKKAEARESVLRAISELHFGKSERIIRINALDTEFANDDIETVIRAKPDAIIIPKVEAPDQVTYVVDRIPFTIPVIATFETAKAVMNIKEIAAAPSLVALCFGAEDYIASVGGVRTQSNHEVAYARSVVPMCAAVFNLQALDMVYVDFKDEAGLRAETRAALELGYSGKTAIHPNQIAPINETFTPSKEEIDRAQKLLSAFNENQAKGAGAFAFEGKMVDMPVIRAAQNVLARAGLS
ncbi:MAG: CoA ester lyase [Chloroflexi bacterium]|nr:CoA ester lyase [Chloroflexota bacterium]